MAGILDSKQRVMDTIITLEGRRQVSAGDLQIKFVSFTDGGTFYYPSGSTDVAEGADNRVFFEAFNRMQDQIIFETDDAGLLQPFNGSNVQIFANGKLRYGATGSLVGSSGNALPGSHFQLATGSQVISLSGRLLASSSANFSNQYIIASKELFSENNEFEMSPAGMNFTITNTFPFTDGDVTSANLENVESLWQDMRLAHLSHYQYLPPVNKPRLGRTTGAPLGYYTPMSQKGIMTYQELEKHLETREVKVIDFVKTSNDNNIVAQLLDIRPDGIDKLALIDFGEFPDEDPYSPGKRVFFAGKTLKDASGFFTFINLFTIVFD